MSKLECEAVIVVGSRASRTTFKKLCETSKSSPIVVGGDSYEMMELKGVGLCFCVTFSSAQVNARIAKLSKINKHFNYQKVIVIDPPYTEATAKNARVGVTDVWYFVKEKQALLDLLKIDYERLDARTKKLVDKLITPPPPPPALEVVPDQLLFQNDWSYGVMRGPDHQDAQFPAHAFMSMLIGGGGGIQMQAYPRVQRRAPDPPAREAQPEVKKAKAISQDEMECLCCAENQKDTILNCGHLELCGVCASKVESCPTCSVPITERKHVWL